MSLDRICVQSVFHPWQRLFPSLACIQYHAILVVAHSANFVHAQRVLASWSAACCWLVATH